MSRRFCLAEAARYNIKGKARSCSTAGRPSIGLPESECYSLFTIRIKLISGRHGDSSSQKPSAYIFFNTHVNANKKQIPKGLWLLLCLQLEKNGYGGAHSKVPLAAALNNRL
jgi:hypothetical protein